MEKDKIFYNEPIEQKNKTNKSALIALIVIIIVALAIGSVVLYSKLSQQLRISPSQSIKNDGNSSAFTNNSGDNSIEFVSSKLALSVVSIVSQGQKTNSIYSFGSHSKNIASAGTGIVVSSNGYILTNKHVIGNDSNEISVVMADGTTYDKVKLVATDPINDIAFLKIDNVSNLSPAELGDSKSLNIGQQVIAIGNALGQYDGSVTSGIISGVGRTLTATDSDGGSSENLSDMIQTDAAINSGNSGGPLVNAKGQVIGINTAVASEAQGIGFAIPIASVKGMLNSLLEKGSAKRAFLGANYINITPQVAKKNNLSVSKGALVESTSGPALRAGLEKNDIITKVNGTEVGKAGSVSTLVAEYKLS